MRAQPAPLSSSIAAHTCRAVSGTANATMYGTAQSGVDWPKSIPATSKMAGRMPAPTALASQNAVDDRMITGMSPGTPESKRCSPNEVPNLQHAMYRGYPAVFHSLQAT
jgi:hypothetical protein